jgi:hypothetical protein
MLPSKSFNNFQRLDVTFSHIVEVFRPIFHSKCDQEKNYKLHFLNKMYYFAFDLEDAPESIFNSISTCLFRTKKCRTLFHFFFHILVILNYGKDNF